MRRPKTPPSIDDFMHNPKSLEQLERILSVPGPLANGKYLHWDKLRHYTPPSGLSHAEWWCGIKLQRRSQCKNVPLVDRRGKPFRYLLVDPIPERLHEVDLGAGGRIEMPREITNPETKDKYYLASLVSESITSSQLEGATTTRRVAKEMLRTGRRPRNRSERMILNNYLTMKRIGALKQEALDPDLIFEIHRRVTTDTLDDASAAGRLRTPDERVYVGDQYGQIFHEPPEADALADRMRSLCDFANGKTPDGFIHPVIRSIILHFWLAYDHPFVDGNGRTARALFYWSMLRHGLWLFEFVSISQVILKAPVQYGRAYLYAETDDNDLTYFILYHMEIIRKSIQELHEYVQRKAKQLRALEAELRGIVVFNHRQRSLISHALRHPHFRYTIESHRASHGVVYQTARTDLLNLCERGLFEASKIGRRWFFMAVPDLENKLDEPA